MLCAVVFTFTPPSFASSWLDQTITPADARHLLARTGFDAAPESQLAIAGLTRGEAVDVILDGFNTQPQVPMPEWTADTAPLYWTRRDMAPDEQRKFDRLHDQELANLRVWWIDEMLTTTSPQTERMVLFWHDHFATSYNGINRQSMAMARQNQTFRDLAIGSFEELLRAMIRDPALLTYLSNLSNRKTHPNENLARELMELFTLGEGNYDEHTVKEAARALTGYGISQNRNLSARFNEWQHDWEDKELFGETGTFNGDDLVTLLLKQPALDNHIATRFWHFLVADRAPLAEELAPLAQAFRSSGHRLDALYRAVLESSAFWDLEQRGAMIKSPTTLLVGAARTLDTPKRISQQFPKLLKLAGQDLFAPPNVSGWEEGPAWITSGRLLNRYTGLKTLLASTRQAKGTQSPAALEGVMGADNLMAPESTRASSDNMMMADVDESMNNSMSASKALTNSSTPNETPITSSTSTSTSTSSDSKRSPLFLKLAAENYEGPVRYRLELLKGDASTVWRSDPYTLKGGWDSAEYGPVGERFELPWQTVQLPVSTTQLKAAHILRVHFINDAADGIGDRNLYVGALSNGHTFAHPQAASQVSACPPESSVDVGNLYCNGYVDISLTSLAHPNDALENDVVDIDDDQHHLVRYASKHIGWANHNASNGVVNARIVFQDLRYKERHWPVFTAWYRVQPNGEFVLWLNSQECWPGCVEQWPTCAWANEREPENITLHFNALGVRNNSGNQCHVNSLQQDEATLVDALLVHAKTVLAEVLEDESERFPKKRSKVKESLAMLIRRAGQEDVEQAMQISTPTNRTSIDDVPRVVQAESAKRHYPDSLVSTPLRINAVSLNARHRQIQSQGFNWAQVLAPGIELKELPGWSDYNDDLQGSKLYDSVQQLLLNPAYQVY